MVSVPVMVCVVVVYKLNTVGGRNVLRVSGDGKNERLLINGVCELRMVDRGKNTMLYTLRRRYLTPACEL